MNRLALLLVVTACGKSDAPPASGEPAPKAVEKAEPTPANNELPAERDAEAAKLVKAGAACKLVNDDISLSCPENKAAREYASKHQGMAVTATCAELVRDSNQAIKLVAARCLDSVGSKDVTKVLGHILDSIEAETNPRAQSAIASAIYRAEAVTAKLEDRATALVEKLAAKPATEDAGGGVMATLFSEWGVKPPKRAQEVLLAAFQRKQGGMFSRRATRSDSSRTRSPRVPRSPVPSFPIPPSGGVHSRRSTISVGSEHRAVTRLSAHSTSRSASMRRATSQRRRSSGSSQRSTSSPRSFARRPRPI